MNRPNLVKLIGTESNSFGDQIIKLEIDGRVETHVNHEGNWVNVDEFLKSFKAVCVERSGAAALNRIFGDVK